MIREPVVTRFAPSPSGQMHLGNARTATGLKGAALFRPLRAALTGRLDGPELVLLLKAMPEGLPARRLARFA